MQKLKYAIIGCGRVAPNHINSYLLNKEHLELVAACDIDIEKIEDLISDLPQNEKIARYTDYRTLLAAEKPQLVAVATSSGSHAEIALEAINSGANVIVEKPIALSISDADMLVDAANKKGVVLSACHQNRFNKAVKKIREAVEQNRFGKLLHGAVNVRWHRDEDYYKQAAWRGTWSQDGGALMNQCIHGIDLLRWMMGDEVEEVMAYTDRLNHNYIEAEDLGIAIVRFKSGAYATIEGTTNVYQTDLEETLYLFGEKGMAKAGGTSVNMLDEWNFSDESGDINAIKAENSDSPENVYGFGHSFVYADVINAIFTGCKPYIDGVAGRNALEMVLAIYKSAAEGKPIKLPLKECATVDFIGRFDKK